MLGPDLAVVFLFIDFDNLNLIFSAPIAWSFTKWAWLDKSHPEDNCRKYLEGISSVVYFLFEASFTSVSGKILFHPDLSFQI